jgi:hypothetical protein
MPTKEKDRVIPGAQFFFLRRNEMISDFINTTARNKSIPVPNLLSMIESQLGFKRGQKSIILFCSIFNVCVM